MEDLPIDSWLASLITFGTSVLWTNAENYWQVFQDGTKTVKDALDAAGIGIPFPQMDVHLDKLEP